MPSSYTTSLRLVLPVTGELTGTWGDTVNNGLTALAEAAIAGTAAVAMTDANYTLTTANGAADEARNMFVNLTGTLTQARDVICPAVSKLYVVNNGTTGGFSIVFKTSGGSGITVPNGKRMVLYCDGTNVVHGLNYAALDTTGNAGTATSATTATNLAGGAAGSVPMQSAPDTTVMYTGQLAGLRNKIINGKMDVAQRGATFTAVADGAYNLDRWQTTRAGTAAVVDITQSTDVPGTSEFQYSLRATVTTADASIAAGDLFTITQRVEGYNARDFLNAASTTLSFWARSSKTGTHCVALKNSGSDRALVATYTINVANTWERKTVVFSGLITGGTWNWTNGIGVTVVFSLAVGSTYQTTAGSWQTGNFFGTSAQVNCLDTIGNIFAITGVQFETGVVATAFEHRPYGMELQLCQRYYFRTAPASGAPLGVGFNNTTTATVNAFNFPTPMRTAPSSLEQSGTATDYRVRHAGGTLTTCSAAPAFLAASPTNAHVILTVASGLTAGQGCVGESVNTSGFLAWPAEL